MKRTGERTHVVALTRALSVSILLVAAPSGAVEFRAGQHLVIGPDEVILDDLYATGETITVEGRVEGDVIASAREVRMNGELTGDLMACGQAVVVNGRVGDDVRIAGMALKLGPRASIGDDLVSAGLSLETEADSLTGGSLLFAGFQALLAGDVQESLLGSMSALEIRGGVGGDSEVEVEGDPNVPSFVRFIPSPVPMPEVPGGLTIADSARIAGSFEYVSSTEARGSGATGRLTRREPTPTEAAETEPRRRSEWPGRLFKWLGLIALGLLLAWWFPGWLNDRSGDVQSRPLPLAGLGLLGLAALPVAAMLIFALAVGLAIVLGMLQLGNLAALVLVIGLVDLAFLVLLFWMTAAYLAPLIVGLCSGRWVLKRFAEEKAAGLVLPLIAGLALLAILRYIPWLGFLVGLAVLLLGWGAILVWLWSRLGPQTATS